MEQDKRKIIVREIEHWRRSRLLPEHYCDFLLNLYDDNPGERDSHKLGVSKNSIKNSNWKIWFFGFGLMALVAFIVLHFNSFRFPLQMAAAVAIVAGCYGYGLWKGKDNPVIGYGLVGLGSVALLGAGFYLLRAYGMDEPPLLLAYVAFCSFVWIIVGLSSRMGLFHYCGWAGLMLVYAWVLRDRTELDWIGAQLSWLPVCVVFGWLGWLLHRASKSTGAVLLLVCFTLWWMPEAYSLYAGAADGSLLQLLFLGKLIVAGVVLFTLRKKWIEWVL
ncbi:hypothetical protein [Paenibacillus flagellatus]|uniref:DUF2157 domain-containing protein n=1 Tax=Paenibacillus flagellatus TaxID=2211139 RepID=A0A2V5JY54_9BACL|nr:hypothetical protein [Paenibacillus flagellatus]PYI51748.1 hypothetical protein DLM86_22760 [Paenibacillus flagellatus]